MISKRSLQTLTILGTIFLLQPAFADDARNVGGASVLGANKAPPITTSAAAPTPAGSHASADIGGDILQINNGTNATVDTLIGSARINDPSPDSLSSSAIVKGDVDIFNNPGADKARVETLIGSVSTGGSADQMSASAIVEGDVFVQNMAANSDMVTSIGSIDGMDKVASSSAHVGGSVRHGNTGTGSSSTLMVGSLKGASPYQPK